MIRLVAAAMLSAALGACATGDDAEAPITSDTTATTVPVTTTAERSDAEPEATAPTSTSAAPTTAVAPTTTVPGSCVDRLDLAAAAALVVWPAAEASRWDEVVAAVEQHGVGGVILMRPDGWDADEITRRLAALEAGSRHGLVVSTDEEGGDVQRLRVLGELPGQRDLADLDPATLRTTIAEHGRAVRAVGVDVVFGPVVDVEPVTGDVPLSPSRFFPGEPLDVVAAAEAVIDGWRDAGLVAALKHFPGHGAASGDTHDVDGVTPELDTIEQRDLVPYRLLGPRAADGDVIVMVGHLTVPGLTDGRPATRSPEAVGLLRSIDGYADALVVTDALGMAAVGLPEPAAAVEALGAGLDVALFTRTSQTGPVIDAIVAAVDDGRLDESRVREAAARVMTLLERDGHTCDRPDT